MRVAKTRPDACPLRRPPGWYAHLNALQDAQAQIEMARDVGLYTGPEGAATWAAIKLLYQREFLTGGEDVMLFSTSLGLKY